MKSIIVGTAGHVDHGKTALVKALTGIDADRLAEEKRRGITIDLGFAHMDLPGADSETIRVSFVDVPGHERFVRNMLAGVGGMDLVLLIIAADEAVKPQTREHLDILQLLGVRHGITVLTKRDAVDEETLEVVKLEVQEFLRGTFLETPAAPLLEVSALTGSGLEALKAAIVAAAHKVEFRDSQAFVRLPLDRVFTMKGFGTVVTGTLVAGTVRSEDELELLPSGQRVRVRGIQVHGLSAGMAVAGQRTALNLAGARTEDLSRGMTLTSPGIFATSRSIDVRLNILPSAPRAIRKRMRVHFHSHTMETVAEVIPYENDPPTADERTQEERAEAKGAGILPGESRFARLKLVQPALVLPGDRFIIRQFSPVMTIGGGIVLDAMPIPRMPEREKFLKHLAGGDEAEVVVARVERRQRNGISIERLVTETGWTKATVANLLARLEATGKIIRFGELVILAAAFEGLKTSTLAAIGAFHQKNPLLGGIGREELRALVKSSGEVHEAVTAALLRDGQIEVAGEFLRLRGHRLVMKDEEAESKKTIELAFAAAGLKVPALAEVIAGLKIDKSRAQKIVTLLLRDKSLIKISDELVFHRNSIEELRQQMALYKIQSPTIDVAKFKELTGVSRKYAIPLLEFLDRERVTRRVGDSRTIL